MIQQRRTSATRTTTSSPPTVPPPCERKCRDEHEDCEMWALRGECRNTADYMQRHCRKSCKSCCSGPRNRYNGSHAYISGSRQQTNVRGGGNTSQFRRHTLRHRHSHRERKRGVPECVEKRPYE
ncbi:hypothetical protein BaRGS_00001143 [Batillaria attramentaria]|uniref:ShKT domain-containing protein n=1 Tax=Batillaria attramentaria TaxID=370345 RepID=A0ABD0M6V7_9CAEN